MPVATISCVLKSGDTRMIAPDSSVRRYCGLPSLSLQQRIGEVVRAAAEVDAAVLRVECDAQAIDLVKALLPAAGDLDLLVGLVVAVGVDDQHAPRFADDEHAVAALVAGRREVHADRRPQAACVVPEQVGLVFEAVAVRVAEQPDFAVVAEGDERAIRAILHVVDIREIERQLANGEARHEHLHGRRILRPILNCAAITRDRAAECL